MSKYNFYYDESEHSRKINYKTVSASNYYDNFVTMIVGWSAEKNDILQQHAAFETRYADRKDRNGEIKSTMFPQKQFKYGFASLNKQNTQFLNDFLSLFDEDIHIYFSVSSKIEYLVLQLFQGYRNSFLIDADLMKYSITKALVVYRPHEIIKCLYGSPEDFLEELKRFFQDRIEYNKNNPELKQAETMAFQDILLVLDEISDVPELDWDYHMSFDGFNKYLQEKDIQNYSLIIDKEVGLKTKSSYREIPIPDYVFETILKERQVYERNRNRRKGEFQDMDYICCSNYGKARSKGFHCRYYKQLLAENGLPDIRWHDLRSTYCTLLLKEAFNPKAVSKLMGHAKELITMDVYADNKGIIADGVPEIEEYMKEVLPNLREIESFKKELLEIVVDVKEFLPDAG